MADGGMFEERHEPGLAQSVALAVVHSFMTAVNRAAPHRADAARAIAAMRGFDEIFGVLAEAPARGDVVPAAK